MGRQRRRRFTSPSWHHTLQGISVPILTRFDACSTLVVNTILTYNDVIIPTLPILLYGFYIRFSGMGGPSKILSHITKRALTWRRLLASYISVRLVVRKACVLVDIVDILVGDVEGWGDAVDGGKSSPRTGEGSVYLAWQGTNSQRRQIITTPSIQYLRLHSSVFAAHT